MRRPQITAAALELLQHTPLAALSTRAIARHLRISQPALFRHFRSRDAILLEAVAEARSSLASVATDIIEESGESDATPVEQLRTFTDALLRYVQEHPGLVRLLFAFPPEAPLARALRHLMAMQIAFAAELIRLSQAQHHIAGDVDAEFAARSLVGLLQGAMVQWQARERDGDVHAEGLACFELWLRAVTVAPAVAVPVRAREPAHAAAQTAIAADRDAIRELDVRPTLARGEDPLTEIMTALRALPTGGVLKLIAPFRPRPLLALLQQSGHAVRDTQLGRDLWYVEIVVGGGVAIDDLRDLEAPQPLERVILAAEALTPGACYLARVPRFPALLLEQLGARAVRWSVYQEPDGTALIRIARPAPAVDTSNDERKLIR